ncbi:MAG: F0F1 ATP synthase subunit B [Bacteroidaceae bacterium]|jgi:F-type H+-transporting ATPase subunit b|nr:F0F1 ATP synthase subunit B [Bacteroidaceae bacterium]
MNLLTPDPGLLFWMVISFGIVFFLLSKFGFPVIIGMVNKRKEYIEMSLLSARQANEKLEGIKEEGERLLLDAKNKQQEIVAGALAEKTKIVQAAQQQASSEASRIVSDAHEAIERAKSDALSDVRDEVAELALKVAETVMREKMSDDAEQKKAVLRIIEQL